MWHVPLHATNARGGPVWVRVYTLSYEDMTCPSSNIGVELDCLQKYLLAQHNAKQLPALLEAQLPALPVVPKGGSGTTQGSLSLDITGLTPGGYIVLLEADKGRGYGRYLARTFLRILADQGGKNPIKIQRILTNRFII